MAKVYVNMLVSAIIDTDLENPNDILDYIDVIVNGDDSTAMVLDSCVEEINVTDAK